MTAVPVMAAYEWPSNASLIAACARLGYLKPTDRILDPTYGGGGWWKLWQPAEGALICHSRLTAPEFDYRHLPHRDSTFDAVTFDPPYVAPGGRATSTLDGMNAQYGMHDTPATPAENQAVNNAGLAECARVLKPGGYLITKCMDYVWSGKLQIGTHWTLCAGLGLGLELVDRLEHVGRPRPQPARSRKDGAVVRQHHARRNLSTLLVFVKPRRRVVDVDTQGEML